LFGTATASPCVHTLSLHDALPIFNHRFLETGMRVHDDLRTLEPALRERIAARVKRGKLDLTLRLRAPEQQRGLQVDEARVEELAAVAARFADRFPGMKVEFTQLLQFPGVLQATAVDPEALKAEVLSLLD